MTLIRRIGHWEIIADLDGITITAPRHSYEIWFTNPYHKPGFRHVTRRRTRP